MITSYLIFGSLPYLVFTLAKQLLFAQVIDSQQFPNSHQHSSLERSDGQRDVLDRSLSNKTQRTNKLKPFKFFLSAFRRLKNSAVLLVTEKVHIHEEVEEWSVVSLNTAPVLIRS